MAKQNRYGKQHIRKSLIFACLTAVLLAGCGSSGLDGVTGKEIGKDGRIRAYIVKDFDESLYSVTELEEMINKEVSDYNGAGSDEKVGVESVKCEDSVVTVVMDYESADDYARFNDRRFEMTALDTAVSGEGIRVSLKDAESGTVTAIGDIEDTGNLFVMITDETGHIAFPGKVKYFSDGVESVSAKQVNVTDEMDGLAYIIYIQK